MVKDRGFIAIAVGFLVTTLVVLNILILMHVDPPACAVNVRPVSAMVETVPRMKATQCPPIPAPVQYGDCVPRQMPPPQPSDSNPHVYDVFAADHLQNVYFVTQRYYGRCEDKAASPEKNRDFLNQVFICQFTAASDPSVTEFVYSRRVYKTDVYFATTVIQCRIPKNMQHLANNAENKAMLNVSLIPTHNLEPGANVQPLTHMPVCANPVVNENIVFEEKRHHYLSACLWLTGDPYLRVDDVTLKHSNISDILPRLKEWMEFHRMVGFDHFYVYDNSAKNHSALWEAVKPYVDQGIVTYIHWPAKVCFRHRSSQYAAENSCFRRFGQYNTWMAHLDVDEYMMPLGDYNDLPSILKKYEKNDDVYSVGFNDHIYGLCKNEIEEHDPHKLFLEERTCFTGKKVEFKRKEIVKPDRVLYHFVHYVVQTFDEKKPKLTMLNEETEGKLVHTRKWVHTPNPRNPSDPVVQKWLPGLKARLQTE